MLRTFSHSCRERFGEPVGKIPLDLGRPCPNRRLGGCVFCQAEAFAPQYLHARQAIGWQVEASKARFLRGRFFKYYLYFQQESCTAEPELLLTALDALLGDPACVGAILATRPDCLPETILSALAARFDGSGKSCLIEIGVQSIHDKSLAACNRNHSVDDVWRAGDRAGRYGCFELGAHLIFGLPGEDEEMMRESHRQVCARGFRHLKFHHLQVVRGTPLHHRYLEGGLRLFELDGYLRFLATIIAATPADVTIHRLWASCHPRLLVAPRWNLLAADLRPRLDRLLMASGLWQGCCSGETEPSCNR